MNKKILLFGLIILFVTTNIPSSQGEKTEVLTEDSDQNKFLMNLIFYCSTPNSFNEKKYEYYKGQLLGLYSSENLKNEIIVAKNDNEQKIPIEQSIFLLTSIDKPRSSAWPMICYNNQHTSLSPYSTADNLYIEKWRFHSKGFDDTPIIADDGTIYVGDSWGVLFALYPDGTEKWRYKTDSLIAGSSPAIAEDGTVYVGSWDTGLYAINPDGTKKWRIGIGGVIASSPAIGDDGTIYIGHMENHIVAVNPNGTKKWSYPTESWITSDPAIGVDGTIYIGSSDSNLYAMNPDGTLKWKYKTGHYIKGPPSIAEDGTIYIGSWDDYLYALCPNGSFKWKIKVGYGTETNPSISSDGTIYVGGWEYLWAINSNGTMKWSFYLGSERHIHMSDPAVSADGTIYVGTNIGEIAGGEIIGINSDGTERWRKKIANEWVDSSPSIGNDGTVYIGSKVRWGGYVHAFGNVETNSPPETPTIEGETNGEPGKNYWYTLRAIDPDNNPVRFYIEWGDGTTTDYKWERASGENSYFEKTYSKSGKYTIRAKAKDMLGEESDWGELQVTMPKEKATNNMLLLRILERFPLLQKLMVNFIKLT